ncbi:MAG: DUF4926 domain-containing protein [Rhizobacter sp.]|nr:DUF4926 domain-containing protein [Chlorobiales bacterium]
MINELDVIALAEAMTVKHFAEDKTILLRRGQVGTVVEVYKNGEAFEVEFSDNDGQTYAMIAVKPDKLIVLYHDIKEPTAKLSPQKN